MSPCLTLPPLTVYGPLANGLTTVMLESIPTYPDAGRYWQMIQEHKITVGREKEHSACTVES